MYYKIERTYVTDEEGRSCSQVQLTPLLLPADNAPGAVAAFVVADGALTQLGDITHLRGDNAVATLTKGRRVMVIFVQRAAESLGGRNGEPDERSLRPG